MVIEIDDVSQCKICSSRKPVFVKKVKDSNHFLEGQWSLFYCNNCHTHFLMDPPNDKEMAYYYPKNAYYTHNRPAPDSGLLKSVYDYFYTGQPRFPGYFLLALLGKYINMFPPRRPDRQNYLLDVGCGNGQLLQRFSMYGFMCDGYDVDPNAIEIARQYSETVYSGDFYGIKFDKKYDVVIFNQVLEHLHDPINMLCHVKEHMTDNGSLIISVPNASCIDFTILGDCWTSFQAPTHIFHYNAESLEYLLNKSGFHIYKIAYSSPLGTMKPYYLKRNISNLFKMEKGKITAVQRLILFILSLPMTIIPFLSRYKSTRITVYAAGNSE